jgi:hypothetical protein
MVWDRGTYEPLTDGPVGEAIDNGHLSFWLEGEKPQWLLIKRQNDGADARRNPVSTQPKSVISGRTVQDL